MSQTGKSSENKGEKPLMVQYGVAKEATANPKQV